MTSPRIRPKRLEPSVGRSGDLEERSATWGLMNEAARAEITDLGGRCSGPGAIVFAAIVFDTQPQA